MTDGVLTQEEVDALLADVTPDQGGAADAEALDDHGSAAGPFDAARHDRIVRRRMPTLEIVNDRFARMLRLGIFNFMRRTPDVTAGPVRVQKFSQFLGGLIVPANLNIAMLPPLRGNCLFVIEPSLVFLVIDSMFGGTGKMHHRAGARDFTATEQRIIHRLLEVVFASYEKSWQPVYGLKCEYVRSEVNTQFANIAAPTEMVVASSFNVDLGIGGGSLHICMPYAMLEPIRDLLYSTVQGENTEPDRRWVGLLSQEVQNATVQVVARLAQAQVSVGDVVRMRKGDVIPLDIPEQIVAEVDGVPMFACQYGQSRSHYSIKIQRILSPLSPAKPQGEDHEPRSR